MAAPGWVTDWERAVSQGRFNGRNLDVNFSKYHMVDKLFMADKAFDQECEWPQLPDLPFPQNHTDSLHELYCWFRYHIGILTYRPDPDRHKNPTAMRKPNPRRRPAEQDDRLETFIYSPYATIQQFLSCDWYNIGHAWLKRWCRDVGYFIGFYVDFLLRIKFHYDEDMLGELLATKELLELAKIELPQTHITSLALSYSFARGCRELYSPILFHGFVRPEVEQFVSELDPQDLQVALSDLHDEDEDTWPWIPDVDPASWLKPDPNEATLLALLGPTRLPLTHHVGMVETSTRRILRVVPPSAAGPRRNHADAASAIEEELDVRLGKVILAPWGLPSPDAEGLSDILVPTVEAWANVECHEPLTKNITVLVDPAILDQFIFGMGVSATFAQIVPRRRNTAPGEGYWFVEHLVNVLPSFYIDPRCPQS
ncbi:hypothetical protein GLOTRDRAFT_135918 [Gloeophyllum trabeum ATCC 11539]|uniref:Uncharacterized protein n=1 Tax=Gloeophyllum trabeum (strain ATCC 11539 / FP-39264 / Madison 617) TaxID=670483 RepID=S7RZN2_GLOTA|nr:uncharacterized protein GLOTRDRAFT_135918 [Gloeophyllum trabeum ATCC 11539]EPQ58909.1 hypothetical protein GLOTRDRAFT_135918 [Gloeophyllum trabeum ATCC 11539]